MAKIATVIRLSAGERRTLEGWGRAHKSERRAAERARIVLLAAQGMSNSGDRRPSWARGPHACRSGVRASLANNWPDSRMKCGPASRGDTTPTPKAFCKSWTTRRPSDRRAGRFHGWPRRGAMSAANRSGACCVGAASRCAGAVVGGCAGPVSPPLRCTPGHRPLRPSAQQKRRPV
jgi:hypothetical protein